MGGWEGIWGGLVGGSGAGETFWQVREFGGFSGGILWRRIGDGDVLLAASLME